MIKKRRIFQRGQLIIEYVLLIVLVVALMGLVFNLTEGALNRFINQPQALLQGLSRSGAWVRYEEGNPDSPDLSHHPARTDRHLQVEGRR